MKKYLATGMILSMMITVTMAVNLQPQDAMAGPLLPAPSAHLPSPAFGEEASSPDWIPTPSGLTYAPCVHEVPPGASVTAEGAVSLNGIIIETLSACPYKEISSAPTEANWQGIPQKVFDINSASTFQPPYTNGWWLDSWWTSPSQITKLSAKWTVPSNPSATGGLIYLFPSIEPANGTAIVQPVLQWGNNGFFGGNSWFLSNWLVRPDGTSVYTTPQPTSAGHVIIGTMTRTAGSATRWNIDFNDTTARQSTSMNTETKLTSWTAVQGGVLEVYNVTSCKQLPNSSSVNFINISATSTSGSVTPAFKSEKHVSSCSTSVSTTSRSTTVGWIAR
jgi:hypothetical protein